MGVDLRLLPFHAKPSGDWGCAHDLLQVGRDRQLYDRIRALEEANGLPVPADFSTFSANRDESGEWAEAHYGNTQIDAYGEQVKWVAAGLLVACASPKCLAESYFRTRAAFAYLRELPADWSVALFWH